MNRVAHLTPHKQALVVGSTAGAVASVVALVAYVLVPLTADTYTYGLNGLEATYAVLVYFFTVDSLYHATVLFGVPFAMTIGGLLVVRQWGVTNIELDATIIGGILLAPFVTVWGLMIASLLLIGLTDGIVFMLFALMFGIPITILVSGFVVLVGFGGTISGYALVRVLTRLRPG